MRENVKNKYLAEKWISIGFIILSLFFVFCGWIVPKQKSVERQLRDSISDLGSELRNVDSDDIDDLQEELDDLYINISAKKVYNSIKKTYKILKDAAISPTEIAFHLPSLVRMTQLFQDTGFLKNIYYIGSIAQDIEDMAVTAMVVFILISILVFATFIMGIVSIINHLKDKESAGIPYAVLYFIDWVVFLIPVVSVNNKVDELFYEKVLRLSVFPYAGLILAIAAAVLWSLAAKDYQVLRLQGGVGNFAKPSFGAAGGVYCKKCGSNIAANAEFCPMCGERNQPQQEAVTYCSGCGQPIKAGAAFCPNCGNKMV